MKNFILIILLVLTANIAKASSFSLDKYEINIESNFLGEEIVIFGEKSLEHDLIIILEGQGQTIRLNEKIKKKILWTDKSYIYENVPNFFAIFSLPRKSVNEIFLLKKLKDNHYLISDSSKKFFKMRKALEQKSLYFEKPLIQVNENLFFSRFKIPDNISNGNINIYFYKIIDDQVLEFSKKILRIEKKGLIQKIEKLLYFNSIIYVFALILFALMFSVMSNFILRKK